MLDEAAFRAPPLPAMDDKDKLLFLEILENEGISKTVEYDEAARKYDLIKDQQKCIDELVDDIGCTVKSAYDINLSTSVMSDLFNMIRSFTNSLPGNTT